MPSTRLHQAKVLSHASAGRGYYRLVLKAPEAANAALPGQFVMLRVTENRDPLLARPFGISSIISKSSLEIVYRVVGRGTSLLSNAEPGRVLSLLGPLGKGFPLAVKRHRPGACRRRERFSSASFSRSARGSAAHFFIGSRDKACLPPAAIIKSFKEVTAKVHVATEDGSSGTRGMSTDVLNAFLSKMEKRVIS